MKFECGSAVVVDGNAEGDQVVGQAGRLGAVAGGATLDVVDGKDATVGSDTAALEL